MDKPVVLEDVAFSPNMNALQSRLHVRPGSASARELDGLVAAAAECARPKAVMRPTYVESKGNDTVCIDAVTFTSRILRVNLADVTRVFLYVATCGLELHAWSQGLDDMLHQFWAEEIKIQALRAATRAIYDSIGRLATGKMSTMNPGSLTDWPISQQQPFFRLLGDVEGWVGVTLSDSHLMTPNKSVSGIRFSTERDYINCKLCPRLDCPNRSAPYDADLFDREYAEASRAKGK